MNKEEVLQMKEIHLDSKTGYSKKKRNFLNKIVKSVQSRHPFLMEFNTNTFKNKKEVEKNERKK